MPNPKTKEPERKPGVSVGDEVYFHHQAGPRAGKVAACGQHGVTIKVGDRHHQVKWENVLGHKKRSHQRFKVVDEGEDGLIVEDYAGQRRYLAIPPEARENKMMVKSEGGRRLLLFTKGGPIANRPGLTLRDITDKNGRSSKHWVRTNKNQPKAANDNAEKRDEKPAKKARGADAGYGTHNLEVGDRISFKAGDFSGSGTIIAAGADGVTVKDTSGRTHGVHWAEVTGHTSQEGTKKPEHQTDVLSDRGWIEPEKFNAAEFAKSHDKSDVTPEEILSHFPPDTADKIKEVQARLKSVEETIGKYKQDGKYNAQRAVLHHKIISEILSPQRVKAATPQEGEKPTFTILGGRGGSGKSWFEGNVYDPEKAIVLDADHIKGMLPEYEGWNAAEVHEESGDLFDEITNLAHQLGLNIVHDATMKTPAKAVALAKRFKDAGYKVEAHYMHLPRQEAAKRAVARFLGKTQRYVPVDVVLSNKSNEESFDQVRKLADKWSFRDNNVKQGEEPILISESGGEKGRREKATGDDASLTKSKPVPIILLRREK